LSAQSPVSPPIAHGGRLDAARRASPDAPQPWIDLSTGINPHPYPLPPITPEAWTRLPDDDAFANLEAAARAAYGASPETAIVAGAGAQSFIQLMPRVFPARRVGVLGFTYMEHAACWDAAGACVSTVATLEALAAFDAAVIVNPNNPDGRILAPNAVSVLAKEMADKGGLLVIDESFMDFMPAHSAVSAASMNNVIMLRSVGKAYGLAGLRLGFALCAPSRAALLRAAFGPWGVSGPALAIGARALADADWRHAAAAACARDAARLDEMLARGGFSLIGGTPLYRLARHDEAQGWFARLRENGILVRAFPGRRDWLRFGLPGKAAAWERLGAALEKS
jgi:cobalamin biosynthesis protein CobC